MSTVALGSRPRARVAGAPSRTASAVQRNLRLFVVLALLIVVTVLIVIAPLITPTDAFTQNLIGRLHGPSGSHWLGTDALGEDVAWQVLSGARWSFPVALTAMGFGAAVGIPAGLFAGWKRGAVEALIMRTVDAAISFPFIVLALAVIAVTGRGFFPLTLTLGFGSFLTFARTSYIETKRISAQKFVEAAIAQGVRPRSIVFDHVLRNVRRPLLVVAAFTLAEMIIAEAGLSFLGLGAPSGTISLGTMLANGQQYMESAWWLVVGPGIAIMVLVLLANYFGDALERFR